MLLYQVNTPWVGVNILKSHTNRTEVRLEPNYAMEDCSKVSSLRNSSILWQETTRSDLTVAGLRRSVSGAAVKWQLGDCWQSVTRRVERERHKVGKVKKGEKWEKQQWRKVKSVGATVWCGVATGWKGLWGVWGDPQVSKEERKGNQETGNSLRQSTGLQNGAWREREANTWWEITKNVTSSYCMAMSIGDFTLVHWSQWVI